MKKLLKEFWQYSRIVMFIHIVFANIIWLIYEHSFISYPLTIIIPFLLNVYSFWQYKTNKEDHVVDEGKYTIRDDINCPECGEHHIDKAEWSKRLHKKHLCEKCGHIWQPYEHYTFGK